MYYKGTGQSFLFYIISSEAFCRLDYAQESRINQLAAVCVKEYVTVFVCTEVEIQRPRAPEKIDMSVADAAASNVDELRELPAVEHYIRQAKVAVDQHVRSQKLGVLLDNLWVGMGIGATSFREE